MLEAVRALLRGRLPRSPHRSRLFRSCCIGTLVALAQPICGQDRGTGGPALGQWLRGEERCREPLERWLLSAAGRDLPRAWQQSLVLGSVARPLLADLLANERSNAERRLGVLVALGLASSVDGDDRWLHGLDARGNLVEDRAMAALLLAWSPQRKAPLPDLWPRLLGPQRSPPGLLAVTARLAAARCPGAASGAPPLGDDEIGAAAAAAFAGLPVPAALDQRLWQAARGERHAELYLRGALLGAGRRGPSPRDPVAAASGAVLLARAQELLANAQAADNLRAAAAVAVFKLRGSCSAVPGLAADWLSIWAADPQQDAACRELLPATPPALSEAKGRLAAAFVGSRSPAEALAAAGPWLADPAAAGSFALALARRCLVQAAELAVPAAQGPPEWFFVRWALGSADAVPPVFAEPALTAAAVLASSGRLPRSVGSDLLETVLWQRGDHPLQPVWLLERELVRDLVLAGSRAGGKYGVPLRRQHGYLPPGIDPGHYFFDLAVPLYDFLSRAALPLPAEFRLP